MASQSISAKKPIAPVKSRKKTAKTSGVVKAFRTIAYAIIFFSAGAVALYYLYLLVNVNPNPKLQTIYTKLTPFINGSKTGGFSLVYFAFMLLYVGLILLGIFGRKGVLSKIILPILAATAISFLVMYRLVPNTANTTTPLAHPDFFIFDYSKELIGQTTNSGVAIEPNKFITEPLKGFGWITKVFNPGGKLLPHYDDKLHYLPISFVLLGAQLVCYIFFAIFLGTRKRGMVASALVVWGFIFLSLAVAFDALLGGLLMANIKINAKQIVSFNKYVPVLRYAFNGLGYIVLTAAGLIGLLSFKKN